MKKLLLLTFLFLSPQLFAAWPPYDQITTPFGAILGYDSASATWRPIAVSGEGKMVSGSVTTIGTATVSAGAPPSTNLQANISAAPVAINVTNLVNRRSITLTNTSETLIVKASLDAVAASASLTFGHLPEGGLEGRVTFYQNS